jgi:uncharacterized protein YbjT (DUF2867 family)
VRWCWAASRIRMLAASDFAELVVRAVETPEAAGSRFYVKGPEPLTLRQASASTARRWHRRLG